MRRQRLSVRVALALCAALLLAACGTGNDGSGDGDEQTSIGLALPGPIDDGGFNQGHYDGSLAARDEHGFEFSHQDSLATPQDMVDALRNLAATSDLVIAAGGQFADPITTVAAEFPDVVFAITAGVAEGDNVHSFVKNWAEQSYVAGVLASEVTEAGHIGYVGGLEIPPTIQSESGFRRAVEEAGHRYSSTTIGTFNDPALAQEAASAQIDAGVDVIQGFIDAAEPGAHEAISDAGREVLLIAGGKDATSCDNSSATFLTTPGQNDVTVQRVIDDFLGDTLQPITEINLSTLSEEALAASLVICPEHETPELRQLADETLAAIASGELVIEAQ